MEEVVSRRSSLVRRTVAIVFGLSRAGLSAAHRHNRALGRIGREAGPDALLLDVLDESNLKLHLLLPRDLPDNGDAADVYAGRGS